MATLAAVLVGLVTALVLLGDREQAVEGTGGRTPAATEASEPAAAVPSPAAPPTTPAAPPTTAAVEPAPVSSATQRQQHSRGPAEDPRMLQDITTAQRAMDKFWARHWTEFFPGTYSPPRVEGFYDGTDPDRSSCGPEQWPAGNAFYCRDGHYLAWDTALMSAGYSTGDAWVYLVVAHEWGHAIQEQLDSAAVFLDRELQADCLAGAALAGSDADGEIVFEAGDKAELAQGLSIIADDFPWTDVGDHGDAFERIGAFDLGRSGGVELCLPALAPPPPAEPAVVGLGQTMTYDNGISVTVVPSGYQPAPVNSVGGFEGQMALFELIVENSSTVPFDAFHMTRPVIFYGDNGTITAPLVIDADSDLGQDFLGVIPPGGTARGFFAAGIPPEEAGQVHVTVPAPGPGNDEDVVFVGPFS